MSKDPAFLFYPNDYIGGTMGMTFEEKGAYVELLMLQFNRGHMTSQMIAQTVGQVWVKLQDKFKIDKNGLYYNERLDLEIEKRKSFIKSRFNNLSGTNQYSKKEGHKGAHMTKHMEDEDEDENLNEDSIINYSAILENYHFYCDKLPRVAKLSDERKKHIAARFKEFDLDTIIEVLKKAGKSDFLSGKNDRAWRADIDWIFNPTNFLKIMEGKYENKVKQEPRLKMPA